ncbi:MAG TPA: TonB-dependent receptor, partial [Adhaeribacter sp.]|nr:TonB-dependent receptor [Adhaeribacter sp.]
MVKIFYREEWVKGRLVTLNQANITLTEALNAVLEETEFKFARYDAANLVLLPASEMETAPGAITSEPALAGKNRYDTRAQLIGGTNMAPRGQKLVLSGTVKDAKRNEPVTGARVSVESLGIGAITDLEGNYELKLEAGKYEVEVSALGLETKRKLIQLNGDGKVDFGLPERAVGLKEVQIEAVRKDLNISGTQMGVNKLDIREIKNMPSLLGEADVVKSVQMLPGVTSVGEASAGFNVRGGNTDQNLILLDDVPVFNPTHLFGFFSVFNPDAVQDVTLYRGGIPAQLGGRLSSVLEVKQKEGSYEKFKGTGGIGVVSARLALEGPVMKDRGSILVAGRSSYTNWIFKELRDARLRDDKASFYDATIKLSAKLSDKSKYIFSGYHSHDSFQFNADTVYSWNTTNASLTFNHQFSEKLEGNFTGLYGDYALNLDYNKAFNEAQYTSGIKQKGVKADFTYRLLKQTFRFGASSIYYDFNPGALRPSADRSTIHQKVLHEDRAIESAVYMNDELTVNARLAFTVGLRFSAYQNIGPGPVFEYEENRPRSLNSLTDTILYAGNDVVKPYQGLEPRFSARYSLSENSSLKGGYSRTRQ